MKRLAIRLTWWLTRRRMPPPGWCDRRHLGEVQERLLPRPCASPRLGLGGPHAPSSQRSTGAGRSWRSRGVGAAKYGGSPHGKRNVEQRPDGDRQPQMENLEPGVHALEYDNNPCDNDGSPRPIAIAQQDTNTCQSEEQVCD